MYYWRTEIKRLLLGGGAALLIGLLAGNVTLSLLLALAGYCLLNLRQLRRLQGWLDRGVLGDEGGADTAEGSDVPEPSAQIPEPSAEIPESGGLWGGIFDSIHRLQKQEREARGRLARIVHKAQESSSALQWGVIMTDRQHKLDWWNSASETLLGLCPQDRRQSVTNLVRDPRFADYLHRRDYEEPLRLDSGSGGGGNGQVLEFQIAVFGEQEHLIIVRDISQLHRLELMRKDFVGNVSHELGTPITVIKGYLETMLEAASGSIVKDDWRSPLQQMQQQTLRMENLVRDLLLLSALETRTLPPQQEEISLHEIFAEIRQDSAPLMKEKQHHFSIHCPKTLQLRGKRNEVYSAVSNLVANAAKYTPPQGKISLTAAVAGSDLHITVEDNGMGIPPEHLPRITERFYRVDSSRSSKTASTGLGLAIVKHVLMRHNGSLHIESTPGAGSRFTAKFPSPGVLR